jgi:hypothetical protein
VSLLKVCVSSVVIASLVTLVGCSAQSTEEEASGSGQAVVQGETIKQEYVENFASADSDTTGVDVWDYGLVEKDGTTYVVLSGYAKSAAKRRAVIDVVADKGTIVFRDPSSGKLVKVAPDRAIAITLDWKAVLDSHAAPTRDTSSTTSIHPNKRSPYCKSDLAWSVGSIAVAALAGAKALVACEAFTLGAGTVVCIGVGAVASVSGWLAASSVAGAAESCF